MALLFLDSCVDNRTPIKILKNGDNSGDAGDQTASALDSMSEGMDLSVVSFKVLITSSIILPRKGTQHKFTHTQQRDKERESSFGLVVVFDETIYH